MKNYGCVSAQTVNVGESVLGDTSMANRYLVGPTQSSCEGSYTYDDDVGGVLWYRVQVGSQQTLTVDTCSDLTVFDTRLSVMTAGSSGCYGSLTCLYHASSECGLGSSQSFSASEGTNYYIAVYGEGGARGAFELNVS